MASLHVIPSVIDVVRQDVDNAVAVLKRRFPSHKCCHSSLCHPKKERKKERKKDKYVRAYAIFPRVNTLNMLSSTRSDSCLHEFFVSRKSAETNGSSQDEHIILMHV